MFWQSIAQIGLESPWLYAFIFLFIGYQVGPSETQSIENCHGWRLFFGRLRVVLMLIFWCIAILLISSRF